MQQIMMQVIRFIIPGYHSIAHKPRLEFGRRTRHPAVMGRSFVNSICRDLPGAELSDPWGGGHDAWKIGGKMFACIGTANDGVSVKTQDVETAQMLIDAGVGVKAPYFHRSWIRLPFDTDEAELRHRLAASYQLVRSSLSKKVQVTLPD